MKKYIVLIISFILFVPGLHAAETSSLDFGDYNSYDLIETETVLPTADSTTVNKIYKISDKYYITNYQVFDNSIIELNMNLSGKTIYISKLDSGWNCVNNYYIRINGSSSYTGLRFYRNSPYLTLHLQSYTTSSITSFDLLKLNLTEFYGNVSFTFKDDKDYIVTGITDESGTTGIYSKFYNCISNYISVVGSSVYSWTEIFPTTVFSYSLEDKDMFIFYTFNEISNFDILSSYDFTDFTDFQKLVIVLGFNTFYLGFIGFIVYLFLKLINKLITWLKELF